MPATRQRQPVCTSPAQTAFAAARLVVLAAPVVLWGGCEDGGPVPAGLDSSVTVHDGARQGDLSTADLFVNCKKAAPKCTPGTVGHAWRGNVGGGCFTGEDYEKGKVMDLLTALTSDGRQGTGLVIDRKADSLGFRVELKPYRPFPLQAGMVSLDQGWTFLHQKNAFVGTYNFIKARARRGRVQLQILDLKAGRARGTYIVGDLAVIKDLSDPTYYKATGAIEGCFDAGVTIVK